MQCNVAINSAEVNLCLPLFSPGQPTKQLQLCWRDSAGTLLGYTHKHTHACTVIALIISCFLFVHKELGPSPESDFAKEGQGKERGLQGREGEEKAICWLRSMITQVLLFGWHHTDIFSTDLSSPLTVLSSSFLAACNQNHTAIHFPTVSLSCLFLGVMSKQKCFPR